jgi:hypothetical protein
MTRGTVLVPARCRHGAGAGCRTVPYCAVAECHVTLSDKPAQMGATGNEWREITISRNIDWQSAMYTTSIKFLGLLVMLFAFSRHNEEAEFALGTALVSVVVSRFLSAFGCACGLPGKRR